MTDDRSCPLNQPDLPQVETVRLTPQNGVDDFEQAMALAKREAEKRFEEYMLVSWYDRDRDFESPAGTTECDHGVAGYILYGLNHGSRLKVDVEAGRFVFFFAPVEW
ncbi:MAG: AF1514 family protein [Deltaproteobacteria bacterium]